MPISDAWYYIKYARIRVFIDPYAPVYGQNLQLTIYDKPVISHILCSVTGFRMCFCNYILLNEDTKIETVTSPRQQVKMESDYKTSLQKRLMKIH